MGLEGVQGWAPSTEAEDATEGKAGSYDRTGKPELRDHCPADGVAFGIEGDGDDLCPVARLPTPVPRGAPLRPDQCEDPSKAISNSARPKAIPVLVSTSCSRCHRATL
jgi:hypothetical protein